MRKNEEKRAYMTAVVSDWKLSDLTLEDYCKSHKITLCKFRYWNKKLTSKNASGFSKVELIDAPIENSRNSILDSFKIEYPTGVNLVINKEITLIDLQNLIHL